MFHFENIRIQNFKQNEKRNEMGQYYVNDWAKCFNSGFQIKKLEISPEDFLVTIMMEKG